MGRALNEALGTSGSERAPMKWLSWMLIAVAVAVGVAVLANRNDLRRYQRMRRL